MSEMNNKLDGNNSILNIIEARIEDIARETIQNETWRKI